MSRQRCDMSNSLVSGVEQENERDDSVSSILRAVDSKCGRARGLQGEEDEHAGGGGDEQETTASTVDHERGKDSPAQVPDGENAVDEELNRLVRYACSMISDHLQVTATSNLPIESKTLPR
jgi:hypothetical protein